MKLVFLNLKRKARTFKSLSFYMKSLFFINFFLCGVARLSICLLPLARLAPYFGHYYKTTTHCTVLSDVQYRYARQLGRSIRLAASYTPWKSTCLTQALVALFWCKRFKIPFVLCIGVAKSTKEPSGYAAHAWVSAGPVAMTGGDGFLNFNVISAYSSINSILVSSNWKSHHALL